MSGTEMINCANACQSSDRNNRERIKASTCHFHSAMTAVSWEGGSGISPETLLQLHYLLFGSEALGKIANIEK